MSSTPQSIFPAAVLEEFAELGVDLDALFSAAAHEERMVIEVTHASHERDTRTKQCAGNTQPNGLLHGRASALLAVTLGSVDSIHRGGASAVLAGTLGSVGAMLHGGPKRIAVGVDLNVTDPRGVRSGTVAGEAVPVHRGRSTATYEVVITDEEGRRVCTGRLTCAIR